MIDSESATASAAPTGSTSEVAALVKLLLGLVVVLLVGCAVLVWKVVGLQGDLAVLAGRPEPFVSVQPTDSRMEDVCRILGAFAAESTMSLATLFPDGTVSSCEQSATEGFHSVVVASTAPGGLVAADSPLPAAGICAAFPGTVVTITANSDTPSPRCVKVTADQRLRVVNPAGGAGPITVTFAGSGPRVLQSGEATVFEPLFGTYLAPGVHVVHLSNYSGAEVWLK